MQKMHPQYGGAIRTIDSSPSFSVARYRIDRLFRELTTGGRKPRPRIMFVISTRIGGVPQANRDMMRAIAEVYDCYASCCHRNGVEVLRATVNGYGVTCHTQLPEPTTLPTHASREHHANRPKPRR